MVSPAVLHAAVLVGLEILPDLAPGPLEHEGLEGFRNQISARYIPTLTKACWVRPLRNNRHIFAFPADWPMKLCGHRVVNVRQQEGKDDVVVGD